MRDLHEIDARANLQSVLRHAQRALAALADENEGEFAHAVEGVGALADELRYLIRNW